MRVNLPPPADGAAELHFRVFAGLPDLDAGLEVTDATVNGDALDANVDGSLLTVPVPERARAARVEVALRFSYRLPEVEAGDILGGLGDTLDPAAVGLLARHEGGATLGHWFPAWLPPAAAAEPVPEGFGDIGNFPAAVFRARITVPEGFDVVSGGVNVDKEEGDGRVTFVEEGVGLRDLGIFAGRRRATEEVASDAATVRVTGPRSDREQLASVGAEAAASLETFAAAFAPYAWSELDVVSVPLGSGVAGMEWPGMIWIEQGTFAGGIPGLGDLEDIFEDLDLGDLEDVLGDLGLDDLEDLGLPGLEGLGSTREFVIAHEVAHQWWHALVGNDSITAPVVDEPLAQFSACVHFEQAHPDDAGSACALHTDSQYQSMRALGEPDAPADQPTDAFTSSLQYGGVVYGKAPGLYRALGATLGPDAVLAGLGAFASANAFGVASSDDLRAALAGAAPGRAADVDALWQRWIEEAHGDQDLGAGDLPGGLDPEDLEELEDVLDALLQSAGGR
ncbi:MAG: M1 family aminopeptidase [Actinomycetota bacterium]